ncbi:MAG: HD domain-containing phosphohydrolase [Blastocatellia bacterium]|nr:HD domain-containing phosphohydrolase [Blastocatellia bacterium]
MQAQQALLTFTEVERPLGDRLIKQAVEIDRVEGYSEPHSIAIARMAETLGAGMGLHGIDLTALKFAGLAHDVGLRAMKRNYLLRPDGLTWEEQLDLWRHPILGEQAAGEMRLSRQAQLLIRWHHESWNGQGYPDGLSGEAIPLGARILRVVDAYYALISRRPHRAAYDPFDAEQIIADLAGIEFDPRIVKQLLLALAEERKEREAAAWGGAFGAPFEGEPPLPIYEPPTGPVVGEAGAFFSTEEEMAVATDAADAPGEPLEASAPQGEVLEAFPDEAIEPPPDVLEPDVLEVSPAPDEGAFVVPDTQEMELPLPAVAAAEESGEPKSEDN